MDVSRFVIEGYDKNAVYQVMSYLALACFSVHPSARAWSDINYGDKIHALLDREDRIKTGLQAGDSWYYEGPNILNWRDADTTGGY